MENYKIIRFSVICVQMQKNDADIICRNIEKLLENSIIHFNIEAKLFERINVDTLLQLKKIIISLGNYSIANVILVIGDTSERQNMIEAIKQVNYIEHAIIKIFARVPSILNPDFAERLYSSGQNKKLLFCLTGCKTTILETIGAVKNSMTLAAYMLYHVFLEFKYYIKVYKETDDKISYKRYRQSSRNLSFLTMNLLSRTDSQRDIDKSDIEVLEIEEQSKISVTKALMLLYRTVRENINENMKIEKVSIKDAYGKILYRSVFSSCNLPPFPTATKYGYAILADSDRNKRRVLDDESEEATGVLQPDTCTWVNKRAFIPLGATAVVPIKNTVRYNDWEGRKIKITLPSIKNELNIMPACSDIKRKQLIIDAYKRIGPMEIGLLASCGCKKVTVNAQLPIGILSIADEFQIPDLNSKPTCFYDNNRIILISLLRENGFEYYDFGIICNKLIFLIHMLQFALLKVNLLVTTGSTNNDVWIKYVLKETFNATIYFKNVDIKPGKSITFATCTYENKTKYILSLSANPASVIMLAHIILLPFINKMRFNYTLPATVTAQIQQKLILHSRPRYVWATLSWTEQDNFAKATCKKENSINNKLSNCIDANALLILPAKTPETEELEALSFVSALLVKFPTRHYIRNIPD